MAKRTVILFGRSMLLSLVSASINQDEHLNIIRADSWLELEALTAEFSPDVLIYDLPSANEGHILSLLFKNPRLLLIGLDVETNRAVLLTAQETRSLTMDKVKDIIEISS
jgi:hypothetical protein